MSPAGYPLLTAVIVVYNSADIIADTVQHLEAVSADLDIEILVVDNASSDMSAERASAALRRGKIIRSRENLGYGPGLNLGLRAARGHFVLMMNDDVRPQPGCIEALLDAASSDSVGLVGARMLNPDGSPSFAVRSQLPGLRSELARISDKLTKRDARTAYPAGDSPTDVEMLICACVLGQTDELRRLGGFNPIFFMYGEDIDLCRRLLANGRRLLTVPSAVAIHDRETVSDRRISGHDFSERMLDARNTYYRIWLPRWERALVNLRRAFGFSDQPFRFRYHMPKVFWDGPSLASLRTLRELPAEDI